MAQVLQASSPHDSRCNSPFLDLDPLRHTPSPPPSTYATRPSSLPDAKAPIFYETFRGTGSSSGSSPSSSPQYDTKSSLDSTPPSSISLDPPEEEDDEDDGLCFPSYGDRTSNPVPAPTPPPASPSTNSTESSSLPEPTTPTNSTIPPSPTIKPADDTSMHDEPTRQVDYLSHAWNEEDVSVSWRHIVTNRKTFGEQSRLENASWRTWAKSKYNLKTVEPERLNWMKDCDVTWLYGPLQEACQVNRGFCMSDVRQGRRRDARKLQSEPGSHLSKSDSFLKKPILKKRSVSEMMLQKSLSSSSLIRLAAGEVQAQRSRRRSSHDRPTLSRGTSTSGGFASSGMQTDGVSTLLTSSTSSGMQSPSGGKRHIRFDDKVEQCIAVDFKNVGHDTTASWAMDNEPSSSSEEDLVMMKQRTNKRSPPSVPSSRRDSLGQESKGIAMLPSTTLKYHHDEPYCPGHPERPSTPGAKAGRLQHSSSQETLRPSNPSRNFLLDEEDDDMSWEPSGAFGSAHAQGSSMQESHLKSYGNPEDAPSGLRRTPSGMFMPFDEEEEQMLAHDGMFGRVVNTVNTARDIFSVIYNVGWRS